MSLAALAMMLALSAPEPATLTFVHGDEQVASWLDRASTRRTGDKVRARILRVRHADQAFWLAWEVDCASNTSALITAVNVDGTAQPPSLEGVGRHAPIRRWDRFAWAVRDAVCDGRFVAASVQRARGVAAAIAALDESRRAGVRARPLELIVARGGSAPVLLDRATLDGGGPQWEVRSLKVTGARGVWSGWMIDCDRSDLAVDLQWTAPMVGGAHGTIRRDEHYGGEAAADADQAALVRLTCDPTIWDQPVHGSIDAALRAARANPR